MQKEGEIKMKTIKEFPEIMKDWNYEANSNANITPDIASGSHTKVFWHCHECGHDWIATAHNRTLNGTGCPICSKSKHAKSFSATAANKNNFVERHPKIAAQWHPTLNGDAKPENFSAGSEYNAWWKCPDCGHEWQSRIHHRSSGCGCPECSKKAQGKERALRAAKKQNLADVHPDIAAQWHPTLNGDLTPDMVSPGSNKKVWWKCPDCGHEWETKIQNRSAGTKCPHCKNKQS